MHLIDLLSYMKVEEVKKPAAEVPIESVPDPKVAGNLNLKCFINR